MATGQQIFLQGVEIDQFVSMVCDEIERRRDQTDAREPDEHFLVDADEMARRLGISGSKLQQLVRNEEVPSIKIGTCRRFRPDQVIDALAATR